MSLRNSCSFSILSSFHAFSALWALPFIALWMSLKTNELWRASLCTSWVISIYQHVHMCMKKISSTEAGRNFQVCSSLQEKSVFVFVPKIPCVNLCKTVDHYDTFTNCWHHIFHISDLGWKHVVWSLSNVWKIIAIIYIEYFWNEDDLLLVFIELCLTFEY